MAYLLDFGDQWRARLVLRELGATTDVPDSRVVDGAGEALRPRRALARRTRR